MALSRKDVLHVAKLANLQLKEDEIKVFSSQLSKILDYIENILKLNIENVIPLFSPSNLKNKFREDKVSPSLSQKEALSNAKSVYKGYFKVKAIFNDK